MNTFLDPNLSSIGCIPLKGNCMPVGDHAMDFHIGMQVEIGVRSVLDGYFALDSIC